MFSVAPSGARGGRVAASIIESARNLMQRAPRQQQLTVEEALDKKCNKPECHLNLKRVARLCGFARYARLGSCAL